MTDRFARYSWFTLAFNIAVILWGAAVRATGSGAGCGSHWPLCNGEVVPRAPRLETLVELTHRVTSGIALLLVVGLVVGAYRFRPQGHAAWKAAVFSMLFMLTEAAVGAGLVLFELVAQNQSIARALFMGTHLVNTFFLLAALTLTARFAGGGAPFRVRGHGPLGRGLVLGFASLLVAGVSGAVAALGDTLYLSGATLSPTGELLVQLRAFHPYLSIAAGIYTVWLALQVMKRRSGPETRRRALWVGGLVFVQLVAGAVNVTLRAPVWMQIVHLLLADLLWIGYLLLGASALAEQEVVEEVPTAVPARAGVR